jgi:F-type H+-transporting ATPase subunit epsilon
MAEVVTSANSALHCVVVTPEATVIDTEAEFVALPLFDGEAGVARGRSPLIGRLGYGELRIRRPGAAEVRLYVDGGFAQVVDNVVSVLTNRAIPAKAIDAAVATEQLQSALASRAHGEQEMAIRQRLISQARGQLRVARHVGEQSPLG